MANLGKNSVKGTVFKLNINMEPIDGVHLSDVNWEAQVFVENGTNSLTIKKEQARKVDDDNYIVAVDSGKVGAGKYWITLTTYIPDADVTNGVRIERRTGFTGVTIDAK